MSEKKKIATVKNPVVQAVSQGLFRFENEEQAKDLFKRISNNFIISKEQDKDGSTIRLWIKGFSITPEEKKEGFLGNYAVIKIEKKDKKFTLTAEKQVVELKRHPQKIRPKQKHPDWGHPILRKVLKKKSYKTMEEAEKDIQRLHEEFPEISIPGGDKLYLMVYNKDLAKANNNPTQKIILKIHPLDTGEFVINYVENRKKKVLPPLPKSVQAAQAASPAGGAPAAVENAASSPTGATPAQKGYFSAMVEMKRKAKRGGKKPALTPKNPENPTA